MSLSCISIVPATPHLKSLLLRYVPNVRAYEACIPCSHLQLLAAIASIVLFAGFWLGRHACFAHFIFSQIHIGVSSKSMLSSISVCSIHVRVLLRVLLHPCIIGLCLLDCVSCLQECDRYLVCNVHIIVVMLSLLKTLLTFAAHYHHSATTIVPLLLLCCTI